MRAVLVLILLVTVCVMTALKIAIPPELWELTKAGCMIYFVMRAAQWQAPPTEEKPDEPAK